MNKKLVSLKKVSKGHNKKKINLSVDLSKRLEEHLNYLEMISDKPKEFIVKEALIRYLEDEEDRKKWGGKIKKVRGERTYTTSQLSKSLKL